MGKKPFLDKKKNVRVFKLVNRSVLQDTEELDEHGNPLPDRVFAEVTPHQESEEEPEEAFIDVGQTEMNPSLLEEHAGEAAKYGIFFDDRHYDYTQHLKPIGKCPGAVFVAAAAATISHQDEEAPTEVIDAAETKLNHAIYDGLKNAEGVDPAVLQTLEALEDDAFIDEDAFEDDLIVKLDRDESGILASVEQIKGHRLDKDMASIMRMYDQDGEGFDVEEFEEFDDDIEIVEYDDDEGPNIDLDDSQKRYSLDDFRRELVEGDPRLLDRILYTSSDEEEASTATGGSKKKPGYQVIECEVEDLNRKQLNCQTACEWIPSRAAFKPKIIDDTGSRQRATIEPIRISRKTGMPIGHLDSAIPLPSATAETEDDMEKINKGLPRSKDETAEEKKARKAAVKAEKRDKRLTKKALSVKA